MKNIWFIAGQSQEQCKEIAPRWSKDEPKIRCCLLEGHDLPHTDGQNTEWGPCPGYRDDSYS